MENWIIPIILGIFSGLMVTIITIIFKQKIEIMFILAVLILLIGIFASKVSIYFFSSIVEQKVVITPPPKEEWSLPIEGSSGEVTFFNNSKGYFTGKITVTGLYPNSRYLITLNGKPSHHSNKNFQQRWGNEGYVDIMDFTTNAIGSIENLPLEINLPSGEYDVKFLVKETKTGKYKTILFFNFLKFNVRSANWWK